MITLAVNLVSSDSYFETPNPKSLNQTLNPHPQTIMAYEFIADDFRPEDYQSVCRDLPNKDRQYIDYWGRRLVVRVTSDSEIVNQWVNMLYTDVGPWTEFVVNPNTPNRLSVGFSASKRSGIAAAAVATLTLSHCSHILIYVIPSFEPIPEELDRLLRDHQIKFLGMMTDYQRTLLRSSRFVVRCSVIYLFNELPHEDRTESMEFIFCKHVDLLYRFPND